MTVSLYRSGSTHIIRGYECEMQRFPIERMNSALKAGWVTSPATLHPVSSEKPELSDDELKALAKENGISLRGKKLGTIKNDLKEAGLL